MPKSDKFKVETVERALRASGGFVTLAAKKLKTTPKTVYDYLNRYPQLKAVKTEIEEGYLDLGELKLIQQMKSGKFDAVKYYLERKGKARGYGKQPKMEDEAPQAVQPGEKAEIKLPDGRTIVV